MNCIYGAGSFGTALSLYLKTETVLLFRGNIEGVLKTKVNPYLPNVTLPKDIIITNDLDYISRSKILFLTVPVQQVEHAMHHIKHALLPSTYVVLCSKGLIYDELTPNPFLSQKVKSIVSNPIAILSGPNFSSEMAKGYPIAATLAHENEEKALFLVKELKNKKLRLYTSQDILGVQLGGALKNVYAIAAGIIFGKNMGMNVHAAFLTRSIAEMKRLGIALGAKSETFQGLSTLGDLVLTCSHLESRNARLGYVLAKGEPYNPSTLTEGVATAKSAFLLAKHLNIYVPIITAVYKILYENESIEAMIETILINQNHFFENS